MTEPQTPEPTRHGDWLVTVTAVCAVIALILAAFGFYMASSAQDDARKLSRYGEMSQIGVANCAPGKQVRHAGIPPPSIEKNKGDGPSEKPSAGATWEACRENTAEK